MLLLILPCVNHAVRTSFILDRITIIAITHAMCILSGFMFTARLRPTMSMCTVRLRLIRAIRSTSTSLASLRIAADSPLKSLSIAQAFLCHFMEKVEKNQTNRASWCAG